jgi:hypothetical protein
MYIFWALILQWALNYGVITKKKKKQRLFTVSTGMNWKLMSESAPKNDHIQRRVYGCARLNTNTMFLIIDFSCKIDCK